MDGLRHFFDGPGGCQRVCELEMVVCCDGVLEWKVETTSRCLGPFGYLGV
jgi:hypothetical protein